MTSIWIATHAIKQYAARIEGRDPETLTKEDRIRIKDWLLYLYQRSSVLTRERLKGLGVGVRGKPGDIYHGCSFQSNGKLIALVLVTGYDDAHVSQARKLNTVIKVRHRTVK